MAIIRQNMPLFHKKIDGNINLTIDPDNVFWAITKKRLGPRNSSFQDIISLYNRVNPEISRKFNEFRKNKRLAVIYLNLTDRCNANCSYCYIPYRIRQTGTDLTKEKLNLILNKIIRHFNEESKSKPLVIFHAVEPLLRKDLLFWAIKKFHKKIVFGIQTNGILLEENDIDFLIEYKVNVGISLDSYDEETNNKTRASQNGGNFKYVKRALKWFNGYHRLNIISTINRFNVYHLPKMVEFLHKYKVPCALFNPMRLTQKASFNVRPKQKDMLKYFLLAVDKAMELSLKSKRTIAIGNFENILLAIIAPRARRLMCDISPCGGGRVFLSITAEGDMIPCGEFISLKEFSGGNIFKDSIATAMNSAQFKRVKRRVVEDIEGCSQCMFRNICGSPCPAELFAYKGNMYKKAIFCQFYKKIINHAFKIIANKRYAGLIEKMLLKGMEYEYKLQ